LVYPHTLIFQALMNEVLKPYLRKFVLLFFDDILICNRDDKSHVNQLRIIFIMLQ